MVLKITRKCSMKCKHCLENATPNGQHMSRATFLEALKFVRRMEPAMLVISGGEPFEHPDAFWMIEEASKVVGKIRVVVTSNGTFRFNKGLEDRVQQLGVTVQVTNDLRYYPMSVPMESEGNIYTVSRIESMYPQGRALKNKLPRVNVKTSKCYNLRSIAHSRNIKTLYEAIKQLESYDKFCTPSIGVDGTIYAGESSLCSKIGTVTDSDTTILKNLRECKCDKCGLIKELPLMYRRQVGLN